MYSLVPLFGLAGWVRMLKAGVADGIYLFVGREEFLARPGGRQGCPLDMFYMREIFNAAIESEEQIVDGEASEPKSEDELKRVMFLSGRLLKWAEVYRKVFGVEPVFSYGAPANHDNLLRQKKELDEVRNALPKELPLMVGALEFKLSGDLLSRRLKRGIKNG